VEFNRAGGDSDSEPEQIYDAGDETQLSQEILVPRSQLDESQFTGLESETSDDTVFSEIDDEEETEIPTQLIQLPVAHAPSHSGLRSLLNSNSDFESDSLLGIAAPQLRAPSPIAVSPVTVVNNAGIPLPKKRLAATPTDDHPNNKNSRNAPPGRAAFASTVDKQMDRMNDTIAATLKDGGGNNPFMMYFLMQSEQQRQDREERREEREERRRQDDVRRQEEHNRTMTLYMLMRGGAPAPGVEVHEEK
jgi:hypothetical protein